MTSEPEVLAALSGVRDPELDQDLVELGFVAGLAVDGTSVAVRPRLPSYYRAPNFAYEALRLRELPCDADGERCRRLRHDLGLPTDPESPAFLLGDGAPLTAPQLPRFLRYARLVATSLEGNAGLCRGLLRTRYDLTEEVAA